MSADVSKLWAGLDESHRAQRWSERIDKKLLEWHRTQSSTLSVSPQSKQQIDTQLQPGFFPSFSPPLSSKELEDIRSVLQMDAVFNHRTVFIDGSAQLTARILQCCHSDTKLAFAVLQALNPHLKHFHQDPVTHLPIRNDALIIAAYLHRDVPELTNHLNAAGFDVVDLSELCVLWTPSCYALMFSAEVVWRCVDIVLFDPQGVFFLVFLMYGLLRVHGKTILTQTSDSIFQFITDLPANTTKQQSHDMFTYAYKVFRAKSEAVNTDRKRMDWVLTMQIPGAVTFSSDVGDKTVMQKKKEKADQELQQQAAQLTPNSHRTIDTNVMSIPYDAAASLSPSSPASTMVPPSAIISSTTNEAGSSITFNLRDLSAETPTGRAAASAQTTAAATPPPPPVDTALLERLSKAAETENDAKKLKALLQAAQQELNKQSTYQRTYPPQSNILSSPLLTPNAITTASLSTTPVPRPTSALVKYSEISLYQVFPCIYLEGYLLKSRQANKFLNKGKSSTLSFFGAALHRRFFVLQGFFLTYFKTHAVNKPTRDESLDVRQCWVEELNEREYNQWGAGFEVKIRMAAVSNDKKGKGQSSGSSTNVSMVTEPLLVLFATNDKERRMWMDALKKQTGQV